ncbi:MAG TPA: MFS transporter [Candidatus Limnocylindrales bacterium]|nr:MFS transporter [Candidatus Limnocylindrales bacterium]
MGWLRGLGRDGGILFATAGLRSFAFGFLAVILGPYLSGQGFSAEGIGTIFAAALIGSALMTVAFAGVADRLGRRRVLVVSAGLMALGGAGFALTVNPLILMAAAVIGTISPSGKEVGPFLSVEQAILPQTVADRDRTGLFAAYNVVSSLGGALGALAVGVPEVLGIESVTGARALVWGYVAIALVMAALFAALSPAAEAPAAQTPSAGRGLGLGLTRSRSIVVRLAALFALDAFAGGFVVQGLVAYWFYLRYGVDPAGLAGIFFGVNLLSALSFLAAAPLARRIGLLNTMVFTHLPSNVLLLLVPLMPSLWLAVTMLLARHLLSQLDVPTRQSYTMAVVVPDERSAAAGVIAVARNAASAIAPALAGLTLANPVLGAPFLIAGALKIVYDLAVLATFRHVHPPEESS